MTTTLTLDEQMLGSFDMTCLTGFVIAEYQISSPEQRPVGQFRALADGAFDATRFVGGRSVTVTVRLDQRKATSMQALFDLVMPYMSPRRRPTITFALPGSPDDRRQLKVRGVDAPMIINGPKYMTLVMQFAASDPYLYAESETCRTIVPSTLDEQGRPYPLTFDRHFPATAPAHSFLIENIGTAPADWRATIFGAVETPSFYMNGVEMAFDRNGGLTLASNEFVVVDTKERTVYRNGDPNESVYQVLNFTEWTWDDLRLHPGSNLARMDGLNLSAEAQATVCWRSAWM